MVLPYSSAAHISSPKTALHLHFRTTWSHSLRWMQQSNGTLGLCLDHEFVDGFMEEKEKEAKIQIHDLNTAK